MTDQPHTPHTEEVCSAYVQYHHFSSYGMDDSEETEKSFYRMIAQVEATAEQRGAVKAWRNGYVHGVHDERLREQIGAAEEPNRANPHVTNNRADQKEGDND